MALTDVKVRNAKPRDKAYKLSDEKGLHLYIKPNGSKFWRFKYRYAGKEKLLSIGTRTSSLGTPPFLGLIKVLDRVLTLKGRKDNS